MHRFYQEQEQYLNTPEINRRTAYHEAGHAAAIYLENRRKNLPAVYFQIQLSKLHTPNMPFFAKISGGRQISDPQMIAAEVTSKPCCSAQRAYEADIINYLVGPLAEAKYISLRDNESFNVNLIRPETLSNYGGNADLKEIRLYLDAFLSSRQDRENKLNTLFMEAFTFIQTLENWKCISVLANYILDSDDEFIDWETIRTVINPSI